MVSQSATQEFLQELADAGDPSTAEAAPQQVRSAAHDIDVDTVVIGAGLAGLYQLYRLRRLGVSAHVYESGSDVGGTWFWNRYPGARCDVESIHYSYSFDDALQQDWTWSERYPAQPELLRYVQHVAERFDLRRDITFGARVDAMTFSDADAVWTVRLDDGSRVRCRHVVAATGCLSVPQRPTFEGMRDFAGPIYYTSSYPDGVDLTGKRVAVIGTGSSGIQTITEIGPQVGALTVFQRTANYSVPAHNRPLTDAESNEVKANYPQIRAANRATRIGLAVGAVDRALSQTDPEEVRGIFEGRWAKGGVGFNAGFNDVLTDPRSNEASAEFVRSKIRQVVRDPQVAERLMPTTHPIGTKRICVDTGYFEIYNQDNVELVDVAADPIERFSPNGVVVAGVEYHADVIILATGFDAMTGALRSIDIRNGDRVLADDWSDGPHTYLGVMSEGFPNLFMITGPQSPSVLTNMVTSIELHVDWVSAVIERLADDGKYRIEPRARSQQDWGRVVNEMASATLMTQADSWYVGANIPGKERIFMPFVGGHDFYAELLEDVAAADYYGFERR